MESLEERGEVVESLGERGCVVESLGERGGVVESKGMVVDMYRRDCMRAETCDGSLSFFPQCNHFSYRGGVSVSF